MNINSKLTPPCMDCTGRKIMCHDSCEPYKQFKINKENVQAARAEFMNKRTIAVESANRVKRH